MIIEQEFFRNYPVGADSVKGVTVPEGLPGIREVAEWIRSEPGWSVPFVNADGLLVRHPLRENDPPGSHPYYAWYNTGVRIGRFEDGFDEIGWTYLSNEERNA